MSDEKRCYFCGSTENLHEAKLCNGRVLFTADICPDCPGDKNYGTRIEGEQPEYQQASNLSLLCDHIRERVKDDPELLRALVETLEGWLPEEQPF